MVARFAASRDHHDIPVALLLLQRLLDFIDILTIPSAMGLDVSLTPKLALAPVVKTAADVDALKLSGTNESLSYVGDALRLTRQQLGDEYALLGFSGAPYTLASYMVEGGSSKSYHQLKGLMYGAPAVYDRLLSVLADAVAEYLEMQVDAGADAVQLFDSWAGELSPVDFEQFALPYVQRIIKRVKAKGAPVIYFVNGVGNLLTPTQASSADVLGIDWRIELKTVRERLGADTVVQGNLDPGVLFAPTEVIRQRTFEMLDQTGGVGHIVNLGHGVVPQTPICGIEAFIKSVAEWAENRAK